MELKMRRKIVSFVTLTLAVIGRGEDEDLFSALEVSSGMSLLVVVLSQPRCMRWWSGLVFAE